MKRSCNGCRASDKSGSYFTCTLGYKVEQKRIDQVFIVGAKPLEECPKPKTYDEYLSLNGY